MITVHLQYDKLTLTVNMLCYARKMNLTWCKYYIIKKQQKLFKSEVQKFGAEVNFIAHLAKPDCRNCSLNMWSWEIQYTVFGECYNQPTRY